MASARSLALRCSFVRKTQSFRAKFGASPRGPRAKRSRSICILRSLESCDELRRKANHGSRWAFRIGSVVNLSAPYRQHSPLHSDPIPTPVPQPVSVPGLDGGVCSRPLPPAPTPWRVPAGNAHSEYCLRWICLQAIVRSFRCSFSAPVPPPGQALSLQATLPFLSSRLIFAFQRQRVSFVRPTSSMPCLHPCHSRPVPPNTQGLGRQKRG